MAISDGTWIALAVRKRRRERRAAGVRGVRVGFDRLQIIRCLGTDGSTVSRWLNVKITRHQADARQIEMNVWRGKLGSSKLLFAVEKCERSKTQQRDIDLMVMKRRRLTFDGNVKDTFVGAKRAVSAAAVLPMGRVPDHKKMRNDERDRAAKTVLSLLDDSKEAERSRIPIEMATKESKCTI
jgi:hypothetical protein